MKNHFTRQHLLLHFIVFIWGWSPIFGKAISLQAFQLVWFRIFITLTVLALYFAWKKTPLKVSKRNLGILLGIGCIISFHWFCFYNAIKVSNVSITLVAFSTGTLFTSVIEPVFYKRKFFAYEMIFGLIIIGAIYMIFSIETEYYLGIIFGILAAFTSSLFTVWNGLLVRKMESPVITFYELAGGLTSLTIYLFFSGGFDAEFFSVSGKDYFFLSIFCVVGTAFPFVASVNLLKKLSPYTVTLTVNLETVYGIIFAFILWPETEKMRGSFYIGAGLILLVIFANALFKAKFSGVNKK
ncbi:MAG TPA: DMT family transporter [Bacteroidia bacterium]|nr:DMT family transporter [Bacteroidia bacterium]